MNEIGHHPILRTIHANNDVSIEETTNMIRDTLQALLLQLNDRVNALAACAHFDSALNDAAAMQMLAPSCSLGYLCSGNVYMQQGRQRAAMDVYDHGLKMVPRGDAGYHKLVRARTSAQHAAGRRLDFISKLPLDTVVKNIIPRLLQENLGEYIKVCRVWRDRITPSDCVDTACACSYGRDTLISLGPHIKLLPLLNCCREAHIGDLLPQDVSFESLKQLKVLQTQNLHNNMSRMDSQPFLTALKNSIGSHLTHITIDQRGDSPIQFKTIVESCPNIISIHASYLDIATPPTKEYPNVIDLMLDNTFPEFTNSNLSNILVHLKSLQSLAISPCTDSHALESIQNLCALLTRLECCCSGPCSRIDVPRSQQSNPKGLENLHIDSSGVKIYSVHHVMSLMMPHMETLESFTFKGVLDGVNHQELDDCSQHFNKLHKLSFTAYEPYVIPFCTWVIRHAPYLKSVTLHLSAATHGAIFDALSKRMFLEELLLGVPDGNHDEAALRRMLDCHVRLGDHSYLEKFTIYIDHPMDTQPWIFSLAHLPRLRSLYLTSMGDDIHKEFSLFIEQLVNNCRDLEYLFLEGQDIDGDQLFLLRNLKKLKRLGLSKISSPSANLLSLLACPTLSYLEIPEDVEPAVLRALRDKIHSVNLVTE